MTPAIHLKPSPWKHLALFATGAAFVAVAVLIAPQHPWLAWCCGLLFGACALAALVALLPGSTGLRLEPGRMTVRSLYREWHLRREDVGVFYVRPVAGRWMVCWNYAPGYDEQRLGRRLSSAVAGVEAGLPDTYGMKAAELAELLNRWRAGGLVTAPRRGPPRP